MFSAMAVHPCGRREHQSITQRSALMDGSSLRAQGTLTYHIGIGQAERFIPAGAGNTCMLGRQQGRNSVHPCGRREHPLCRISQCCRPGSSLRAQGTPITDAQIAARSRFIPAGAGNTPEVFMGGPGTAVHPCGRREHCPCEHTSDGGIGSSLRAQGTLTLLARFVRKSRFIPAGAGNTFCPNLQAD